MRRVRTWAAALAAAGCMCVAAGPTWAQEGPTAWFRPGGYAGASGLLSFLQDFDLTNSGFSNVHIEFSADTGFGASAFTGYRFGNGFRAEAELAYRVNDLDEVFIDDPGGVILGFPVTGSVPVEGDVTSLAFMVNAYYDFRAGILVPYLGLGAGVARVNFDSSDFDVDEGDTVFAYQGKAGLGIAVSPKVMLFGGYTFFATTDPTIADADIEYRTHNAEIGLRVAF